MMDQQLDLTLQQLLSSDTAIFLCTEMCLQIELFIFGNKLKNFKPFCFPSQKLTKTHKMMNLDFSSKKQHIFCERNFLSHIHKCTEFYICATQKMLILHQIELFSPQVFLYLLPVKSWGKCQSPFLALMRLSSVQN